jgi:hypothetical protein
MTDPGRTRDWRTYTDEEVLTEVRTLRSAWLGWTKVRNEAEVKMNEAVLEAVHRGLDATPESTDPACQVLIIPPCGHRRHVTADAPMTAAERAVEKAKACPECWAHPDIAEHEPAPSEREIAAASGSEGECCASGRCEVCAPGGFGGSRYW